MENKCIENFHLNQCLFNISRNDFIMFANSYLKRNPYQSFPLRRSNKPIANTITNEKMAWAMGKYSLYADLISKALLRVCVSTVDNDNIKHDFLKRVK